LKALLTAKEKILGNITNYQPAKGQRKLFRQDFSRKVSRTFELDQMVLGHLAYRTSLHWEDNSPTGQLTTQITLQS